MFSNFSQVSLIYIDFYLEVQQTQVDFDLVRSEIYFTV